MGSGPNTMILIMGEVVRTFSTRLLKSFFRISVCLRLMLFMPAWRTTAPMFLFRIAGTSAETPLATVSWMCRMMESPMITASHSISQRGAKRFRFEISKTGGGGGGEVLSRHLVHVFRCWYPRAGVNETWAGRILGVLGLGREVHGVEVVGMFVSCHEFTWDSKRPGGKSTPNVAASSVMSLKEKTVGMSAPRSPSNKDDDTDSSDDDDDGPDTGSAIDPPGINTACLYTMTANKPSLSSPSASDLKDILDLLPNPKDNPIHFVKTLIQTTRNAQLCGADYKFILMTKMGPMYDEDELVAKWSIGGTCPRNSTSPYGTAPDAPTPPPSPEESSVQGNPERSEEHGEPTRGEGSKEQGEASGGSEEQGEVGDGSEEHGEVSGRSEEQGEANGGSDGHGGKARGSTAVRPKGPQPSRSAERCPPPSRRAKRRQLPSSRAKRRPPPSSRAERRPLTCSRAER
ncbi:hypothetical protein QTP70_005829 [Hemibagrus guttatus]|uniref:Uncharacterized protein n=1 Tax=Hemibagrus guttatus TaxID=175788 RepID=A0AAE0V822_9TELE|nr:hypothetical protein QTP70_005829 [Hemibagrus guttatus]